MKASQEIMGWQVLQNVIIPEAHQEDVHCLYVDSAQYSGSVNFVTKDSANSGYKNLRSDSFISRRSIALQPFESFSFATYFNAFPASYWRRWTTIKDIRLSVSVLGTGSIVIYKSNSRGISQRVDSVVFDTASTYDFDLSIKNFVDGGWYWFDILADSKGASLEKAHWSGHVAKTNLGSVTLQITTMNKPDYCIRNLQTLVDDPQALDNVKEILIVDQGTKKVAQESEYSDIASQLGSKLRIVDQENLGGSGGFSRGMYESVKNGSDYALLLDDDITIEPESINRLLTFATFCINPTIVGGHMFDISNKSTLHAFGETVSPWRFQPKTSHEDMTLGNNFYTDSLRNTPWLHRRADVDYNGWWMCLIPTKIIKDIGLSLPLFIKWDDAEYGIRAKEAGYATVSFPGAAVWHISWIDKDDLVGWQAYFHERNRMITALIYSPYNYGGRVIRESAYMDIKHLISMQYFTEESRIMALEDIFAGPDKLHESLAQKLPEIRKMMTEFSDTILLPEIQDYPDVKTKKIPNKGRGIARPNPVLLPLWTIKSLAKQVFPVKSDSETFPETRIAHQDNKWWLTSQYDSAIVSNAEGSGFSWYKRDNKKFSNMLSRGIFLHSRLLKDWQKLSEQYKDAHKDLVSFEAWEKTFFETKEAEPNLQLISDSKIDQVSDSHVANKVGSEIDESKKIV